MDRSSRCVAWKTLISRRARATSAAFPYFKPFCRDETGQNFLDGGIYNNCPAKVALLERRLLWGDVADRHPDMLLSLGTGHILPDAGIGGAAVPPNPVHRPGFLVKTKAIVENIIEDQLLCEKAWDDMVRMATALCRNDRELTSRYIRLNVTVPDRVPRLDQVECVGELESLVLARGSDEEKEVAHRLIASCFFSVFQPAVQAARGTMPLVLGQ